MRHNIQYREELGDYALFEWRSVYGKIFQGNTYKSCLRIGIAEQSHIQQVRKKCLARDNISADLHRGGGSCYLVLSQRIYLRERRWCIRQRQACLERRLFFMVQLK